MTLTDSGQRDQPRGLGTVYARRNTGQDRAWNRPLSPIHSVALTRSLASEPQLHHL